MAHFMHEFVYGTPLGPLGPLVWLEENLFIDLLISEGQMASCYDAPAWLRKYPLVCLGTCL